MSYRLVAETNSIILVSRSVVLHRYYGDPSGPSRGLRTYQREASSEITDLVEITPTLDDKGATTLPRNT